MPKQKTHSGTKKRFRVTRTGKVMRHQRNRAHLLEKKSSGRKRRLAGEAEVTAAADRRTVRRLLKK